MKSMAGKCLAVFLFVLSLSCTSFGQNTTGTILGTVSDSKGGAIANVTVTITNSDQNVVVRTITTDEQGQFTVPLLPVGRYSVKAEASGFKRAVHSGLVLNVSDKLAVNLTLEVGSVNETVTVEATSLQVDTQSATATGVISGLQLRELSLNSRNYAQLVLLVPGASDSGNADQIFPGATAPLGTNVMSFQINGNRREENNWQVDGADNVDRGSNLTLLSFPSIDAISEFRVVRGVYDAEFNHVVCTQWANSNGSPGACQAYGTSIPSTSFDPIAAAYVNDIFSKFPTPNAPTASNPFRDLPTLGNIFNFREDMVKIDHVFGPKLTVNGKYLNDTNPTIEAGGLFTSMPVLGIATTATHAPGHQ